jgi:pyruvate,water dikinase
MNEAVRAPLRELGGRLVERGVLRRWEDMLLVTNDEADAFIADPPRYLSVIDERAALLDILETKEPPFVFEGKPPPLSTFRDRANRTSLKALPGMHLRGIGVSPGRYTGRARLIDSLNGHNELQPGEVIVAETTDASWGPLFLAAGAAVVETGSMISHAAIVSRELGIPAVCSVSEATSRIANGMSITVDGNGGFVIVH